MEDGEILARMKLSYDAQTKTIHQRRAEVESQVKEWLKEQPTNQYAVPVSEENHRRFGSLDLLRVVTTKSHKPICRDSLELIHSRFFLQILAPHMAQVMNITPTAANLRHMANLCTDFCWANRTSVEKEHIQRTEHTKRRARGVKKARFNHILGE